METIQTILEVLILVAILFVSFVGRLWIKNYLPSYFNEKAKNLASKEDIAGITNEVERVRLVYTSDLERLKNILQSDLERLKSDLQKVSQIETKKREVYHEMVESMGVFISGRKSGDERKQEFLTDYSTMWLWAPDHVLKALDELIDLNTLSLNPDGLNQENIKRAYANCVLEMRKDAAYPDTKLGFSDHRFVSF